MGYINVRLVFSSSFIHGKLLDFGGRVGTGDIVSQFLHYPFIINLEVFKMTLSVIDKWNICKADPQHGHWSVELFYFMIEVQKELTHEYSKLCLNVYIFQDYSGYFCIIFAFISFFRHSLLEIKGCKFTRQWELDW